MELEQPEQGTEEREQGKTKWRMGDMQDMKERERCKMVQRKQELGHR
jgi:hypothetical protein